MLWPFEAIIKAFHMGKIILYKGKMPSEPGLFFFVFLAALFPALHLENSFGSGVKYWGQSRALGKLLPINYLMSATASFPHGLWGIGEPTGQNWPGWQITHADDSASKQVPPTALSRKPVSTVWVLASVQVCDVEPAHTWVQVVCFLPEGPPPLTPF